MKNGLTRMGNFGIHCYMNNRERRSPTQELLRTVELPVSPRVDQTFQQALQFAQSMNHGMVDVTHLVPAMVESEMLPMTITPELMRDFMQEAGKKLRVGIETQVRPTRRLQNVLSVALDYANAEEAHKIRGSHVIRSLGKADFDKSGGFIEKEVQDGNLMKIADLLLLYGVNPKEIPNIAYMVEELEERQMGYFDSSVPTRDRLKLVAGQRRSLENQLEKIHKQQEPKPKSKLPFGLKRFRRQKLDTS